MEEEHACGGVAGDPFQPAVMLMIRETIQEAGRRNRRDPWWRTCRRLATPLLLGLGLEEFSVSRALIPELKQTIARWSRSQAEALAGELLLLASSEAVRAKCTQLWDLATFFKVEFRCSSQRLSLAQGQVLITDRASIQPRRA